MCYIHILHIRYCLYTIYDNALTNAYSKKKKNNQTIIQV